MLDKIKTLIETSQSFGILLDQKPEDHEFLAQKILEQAIREKNLPLISLPETSEVLQEKWSSILKDQPSIPPQPKTCIKLPKEKYKVKEVAYEEDEEYLTFILTPQKGGLFKEDLVLENMPPEVHTVFCLFENQSKLENFQDKLQMPSQERTVFITSNEKSLTEKIFDIIQIFNPNPLANPYISTLFFAILMQETNNFTEGITKNTLSLGSLFLENGAQQETVLALIEKEKTPSFAQILGRILARTYIDELLGVSWSFLSHRDLQKTNNTSATPAFFYNLLKKIRTFIPSQKLHVLIWQSSEGIKALVAAAAGRNESYLLPLAQKLQAEPESRFFILGPFENFSQAEMHLRQTIKEDLIE